MLRVLPILSLLFAVGCSNEMADNGMPDAGGPPPDLAEPPPDLSLPKRAPTDHPALPTMDYYGGPVLAAPEVYTIVWKGDEQLGADVNTFIDWMLKSDTYWTPGVSEYAVGKGKAMGVLVLPDAKPATLDDSAVGPMIKAHLADGSFPAPNANTVFSFVLPETTQSTMYGGKGCAEYGGYHAETRTVAGGSTYVPYAINLQCTGGGSLFDELTMVVSHEIAEASTDPHPFTKPGYVLDSAPLGGENGDLCNPLASKQMASVSDGNNGMVAKTYVMARLWSNQAAKAGNIDPCQPAPANQAYFNVAVSPVNIDIAAGDDFDAVIEPYAYGDVGSLKWTLEGQPDSTIKLTPTSGTVMPGDSIGLKVHTSASTQSGSYPVMIYVEASKGGHNLWTSSITVQ